MSFHAEWDEEKNERGTAYVFGIEGWYNGYIGFEKSPDYKSVVNTKLFDFTPGKVYHIATGNIGNILFFAVDGVLALEIRDPDPIDVMKYGRVGFEAFCTKVGYKNLKIKRPCVTYAFTSYKPEF